ncbi:hypothetical protein NGM36_13260 [Streptomyces mutabilis]|uniref:hypothetical protein n=1 Tax=Streptomyces mutabilis TaxID=67332 RepID=UPI0022BA4768|nr:hypothetical protein [Streptomyces mutabilis]MCZ9350756.1 hypothetical protein [Streptomyces mutabilis]
MNTHQPTRHLRAAQAIKGARAARQRTRFVVTVARQLDEIAPGTVRVRTVPVTRDDRRRTFVVLDSATGPVGADREQHRAAFGLLSRAFPGADWSRPQTYDARTGVLAVDHLATPAALGTDTTTETRR